MDPGVRGYLDAALFRVAATQQTRRWAAAIRRQTEDRDERCNLLCVLLVESCARPRTARVLEWVVSWLLRSGLLGTVGSRRGARMTLGPLQLRRSPFDRNAAVERSLEVLRTEQPDLSLDELAALWNGSPGGLARPIYIKALTLALPYAEVLSADPKMGGGETSC